jgi:murein DD-endopeptidase MepM/ murein hydrolase activator NlpD
VTHSIPVVAASAIALWLAVMPPSQTVPLDSHPLVVRPGAVVRWPAGDAERCFVGGDSWAPIGDACWYPIDLLQQPGRLTLGMEHGGITEGVTVEISAYPYPEQRLAVDPEMSHPPQEHQRRIREEQDRVARLWSRESPVAFSLPLSPPLDPLPRLRSFGARRVLNGAPRNPHTGVDLTAHRGDPVYAAEAGVVALAEEHYFSGVSVFIDHGGRLFTMYFHLDSLAVSAGETVSRGEIIGTVGASGRATGPHLHFGVRWRGARIDPGVLLSASADIPTL